MSDRDLIDQARREQLREVVAELIGEQQALAAAQERARAQDETKALAQVRRATLTPREKARLIEALGYEKYMQIPWSDDPPPRDALGRYRSR